VFNKIILKLHRDDIFFSKHEAKIKVMTVQSQNHCHCKISSSHQAQLFPFSSNPDGQKPPKVE